MSLKLGTQGTQGTQSRARPGQGDVHLNHRISPTWGLQTGYILSMTWNVLAIDDHEVALAGIDAILRASGDCELVGSFTTVEKCSEFLLTRPDIRVDIILLDLRLADSSDPFLTGGSLSDASRPACRISRGD